MTEPAPRRPWRFWKWCKRLAMVAAVVLLLAAAWETWSIFATRSDGAKRRDALLAGLDAADPDWRWDRLNARRTAGLPPDAENAAAQADQAIALLPDGWRTLSNAKLSETPDLTARPLNQRPTDEERDAFRRSLDGTDAGRAQLLKLRTFTRGGLAWTDPDPEKPLTRAGRLDRWLALVLLAQRQAELAFGGDRTATPADLALALLALARAAGDEPNLRGQVARGRYAVRAARLVERGLAQGATFTDGQVAELQAAFAAEEAHDRLGIALRGERAAGAHWMARVGTGEIPFASVDLYGMFGRDSDVFTRAFIDYLEFKHFRGEQARFLDGMARLEAAARLPEGRDRDKAVAAIETDGHHQSSNAGFRERNASWFCRLFLPPAKKTFEVEARIVAELRCARAALACERYRMKAGRFPESLADLPKELLPAVPGDPFGHAPLIYTRLPDGPALASTGKDRVTVGWRDTEVPVAVHLYDPANRGRPAE